MDILQVARAASQDSRLAGSLDQLREQFSDVAPGQLDELIELLEFALQQPDAYPQILEAAVADEMVEAGDLPERFDPQVLLAVLVTLYRLRQNATRPAPGMRRGGLASVGQLAARGRFGDTMLAHVSPEEAALLKARGGAGSVNPATGLPEYFKLKKLFAAILPIALNIVAPGLGAAIGTVLGATGTAAAVIGQAVIGGVSAKIGGGNVLQGALLGGLTGGLGGAAGSTVNSALDLGLGATGQSLLGGALVGGVAGTATGQGFGRGALMGAAGAGIGQLAQGLGSGAVGAGIGAGGRMAGNMLAAGYRPREALVGGTLAGLATGLAYKPAGPAGPGLSVRAEGAPSEGLRVVPGEAGEFSRYGTTNYLTGEQGLVPGRAPQLFAEPAATLPGTGELAGSGFRPSEAVLRSLGTSAAPAPAGGASPLKTLGTLSLLSGLSSARPPAADQAIRTLTPEQQEYFNRPSVQWDWNRMQNDANSRNISLSEFMSTFWPQIASGSYNLPGGGAGGATLQPPPGKARGGLNEVARLVRGGGTGREDTVPARLSDGEYVMDAETVALLGDGSTRAGAQKLDAFRAQVRQHKGRALARGKFSPNAKAPATYMKGM